MTDPEETKEQAAEQTVGQAAEEAPGQAASAEAEETPQASSDEAVLGEEIEAAEGTFQRIPLQSLRLDTYTDFNLYLKLANTNRYVLYRNANLLFTERHRAKLQENAVKHAYISAEDRMRYFRYLEGRLNEIVSDGSLTATETSRIVYECSTHLVREIIEKPWVGENIKRAEGLICNTVDHLLQGASHLKAMISIMSADYYTYTHSVNVCVFGVALGQRVGLSGQELNELGIGLLLHDVGKSEISKEILNKPGSLTPEEWQEMKTHPARGVEILKNTQQVGPNSLLVVGQHHEKCTGKGYPKALTSDEIHIYAKIASVADVFDALTTNRSYRKALESFPALRLMRKEMIRDFNPGLFRELIQMLGSREVLVSAPDREDYRSSRGRAAA
ncbi:MAG: HD-GYP domain-containing protein [Candidatus Eisenbacteria sp.]|nr:HD-GYP domain-containing protein [Candidatus Eisenbacteria bacterium]